MLLCSSLSDHCVGMRHGLGVENLQGSGMIAGETSQAYQDTFTISLVMNTCLLCINSSSSLYWSLKETKYQRTGCGLAIFS